MTAHWTFPDPSRFDTGDHGEAEIAAEFAETYKDIHALLSTFVSLPHQSLDRLSLEDKVDEMSAAHAARKA